MKKLLTLALLLTLGGPVQAVLVNVALDAPAYANGPIYGGDVVARLTDGLRNRQIQGDVMLPVVVGFSGS